jgi:hypothetical protein
VRGRARASSPRGAAHRSGYRRLRRAFTLLEVGTLLQLQLFHALARFVGQPIEEAGHRHRAKVLGVCRSELHIRDADLPEAIERVAVRRGDRVCDGRRESIRAFGCDRREERVLVGEVTIDRGRRDTRALRNIT